jgi:hypothetical protein
MPSALTLKTYIPRNKCIYLFIYLFMLSVRLFSYRGLPSWYSKYTASVFFTGSYTSFILTYSKLLVHEILYLI